MDNKDVLFGIGLCGIGLGILYVLNRYNGIRAVRVILVEDVNFVKLYNNVNVFVMGGR